MTHYEVLGVDPGASHRTIRAAYRRRARETHPDTGGSSAEFAAVSVAWWHLGEAHRRAAYDVGLDPAGAEGWGEDVGFDAPVPPRRPRDDVPPVATPTPTPTPRPAGPRDDPSGPVNPFTSSFRALPRLEDELDALRPPPPRLTYSGSKWVLYVIVMVLIVRAAQPEAPHLVSTGADVGMLFYALWIVLGVTAHVTGAERSPAVQRLARVFLWTGVAIYPVVVASSGARLSRSGAIVVLVVWVLGAVVAAVAERWVARTRHWDVAVRTATERHALATRWNALLRTRDLFGRTRFWEATWASTRVWALRSDDNGALLGDAPQAAPQAWADLLRSTGLDVADAAASWAARSARVPDPDNRHDS